MTLDQEPKITTRNQTIVEILKKLKTLTNASLLSILNTAAFRPQKQEH